MKFHHNVSARTSRDIFGLPGRATCEEAMAILKAKEAERLALAKVADTKKAHETDKKAKDKSI